MKGVSGLEFVGSHSLPAGSNFVFAKDRFYISPNESDSEEDDGPVSLEELPAIFGVPAIGVSYPFKCTGDLEDSFFAKRGSDLVFLKDLHGFCTIVAGVARSYRFDELVRAKDNSRFEPGFLTDSDEINAAGNFTYLKAGCRLLVLDKNFRVQSQDIIDSDVSDEPKLMLSGSSLFAAKNESGFVRYNKHGNVAANLKLPASAAIENGPETGDDFFFGCGKTLFWARRFESRYSSFVEVFKYLPSKENYLLMGGFTQKPTYDFLADNNGKEAVLLSGNDKALFVTEESRNFFVPKKSRNSFTLVDLVIPHDLGPKESVVINAVGLSENNLYAQADTYELKDGIINEDDEDKILNTAVLNYALKR